jgi:hypothetical protein
VVGQNTKYKTGDFAGFVICILSCHVCCGETKNKTTLTVWRNIIQCWPLHGYFVSLHGYLLQLSSARLADDQKRSWSSRLFQGLFR